MTSQRLAQSELFDVAELPGRPMLHWHGKRPLREIPDYPTRLRERYGKFGVHAERTDTWANHLYWGDNLHDSTSTSLLHRALLPEMKRILRHVRRVEWLRRIDDVLPGSFGLLIVMVLFLA